NRKAVIRKGVDTPPNKTRYDIRRLNRLLNVSATEWGGDFHGLEQRDMPDRRVLRWVFLRICSSLLLPRARPRLAPVSAASRVHRGVHRPKGTGIRELQGCICGLAPGALHEQEGHTGAAPI